MPRLDRVLNPKSGAVVGDKKASGYMWLRSLKTFTGNLYSVQLDENEIPGIEEMGVTNYSSLSDIPESVDFVVCAVPRQVSPFIVKDCVTNDVGGSLRPARRTVRSCKTRSKKSPARAI